MQFIGQVDIDLTFSVKRAVEKMFHFFSGLFFPKKTYKEPVPIGEGAFVDVLVTYVVSPDEIYVQKVTSFFIVFQYLT